MVKQNSCLVYENLCLQLEVDSLNLKFEKLKLEKTKSETNSRLKYIHHDVPVKKNDNINRKKLHKDMKRVRIQDETPEKLEKESRPSCSGTNSIKNEKVIKIFERKQSTGVPEIKILNEKETKTKKSKKKAQPNINRQRENKVNEKAEIDNLKNSFVKRDTSVANYEIKIDEKCREKFLNFDSSKLELFQVSDMQSSVASNVSVTSDLIRSQSSPEIVQSTSFCKTNIK